MRYLLSTELLIAQMSAGAAAGPAGYPLNELTISAVSFEWILADVEREAKLKPAERVKWRTNVANFRQILVQSGGRVAALSESALEQWGKLLLLDLSHREKSTSYPMAVEERLVVATAAELGLIYLTQPRDWNETLEREFSLALEQV